MAPNTEKRVDPTVEAIAEMFPEEFLGTLRESRELSEGNVKLTLLFFSGC